MDGGADLGSNSFKIFALQLCQEVSLDSPFK